MSVLDEEHTLPNGLRFQTRPGTSDYNTVRACGYEDEYRVEAIDVAGKLVFDIGAHIGGFGIRCAQRGAHVVFVEPIPENVQAIKANLALNDLQGEIVHAALGNPPELLLRYNWNGAGRPRDEETTAAIHAFIGNTGLGNEGFPADTEIWVPTVTLTRLVSLCGSPDIIKTDCEGGEWQLFEDPAVHDVPLIVGEWHDMAKGYLEEDGTWVETQAGHFFQDVERLLGASHDVTFEGATSGAGGFRATLRA